MSAPELLPGRPSELTGRLEKEVRVYDLMDRLGVSYERIDHLAIETMEQGAAITRALHALVCKNLFLSTRRKTAFYLLMLPEEKRFDARALSRQLGLPRLSFADAEHMRTLLNLAPGSVTVMGLLYDTENRVQLLMDRDILSSEFIGFHPCVNTASLRIRTAELIETVLPAMGHRPQFISMPPSLSDGARREAPLPR